MKHRCTATQQWIATLRPGYCSHCVFLHFVLLLLPYIVFVCIGHCHCSSLCIVIHLYFVLSLFIVIIVHCYFCLLFVVIVMYCIVHYCCSLLPLFFVVTLTYLPLLLFIVIWIIVHCHLYKVWICLFFVNNVVSSLEYHCSWRSEFSTVPPGTH